MAKKSKWENPKLLDVEIGEWDCSAVKKAAQAGIVKAIREAIKNMADQAGVNVYSDGRVVVLLKPVDPCDKSQVREDYINIKYDSENFMVEFNFLDALKDWMEFQDADDKEKLIDLAEKIKAMANSLEVP